MAIDNCFTGIKMLLGKEFGESTVPDTVIRAILTDMEKIKLESGDNITNFRKAAQERIEQLKYHTAAQKIRRAENILIKNERMASLDRFPHKVDGLEALLTGTNKLVTDGKHSLAGYKEYLRNKYWQGFEQTLKKQGVLELVQSGQLDHEVTLELGELYKKNGKGGITNNVEALKIAETIKMVQDRMFLDKKNAGALTREKENWIGRQTHDRQKLQDATLEKWRAFIEPKLHEKTFRNVEDKDKFFEGVFNDIVNGKGDKSKVDATADQLITTNNYSTLVPKLEGSRKLEFKDAQAFYEYNKEFGKTNLYQTLLSSFDQNSRTTAELKFLGTNPEAMLHALAKYSKEKVTAEMNSARKAGDTKLEEKKAKELRDIETAMNPHGSVHNRWQEINGQTATPGNEMVAKAMSIGRAGIAVFRLGKAVFNTIPDWMNASMLLNTKTGKNLFGSVADSFTSYVDLAVHPNDRKEFAYLMGLMAEDHIGHNFNEARGINEDHIPGSLSKGLNYLFKLNGLSWQTGVAKTTVALTFARQYGLHAHESFHDLSPRLQENLAAYGIKSNEWDILRKAVGEFKPGDKAIITENLKKIPHEDLAQHLELMNLQRSVDSKLALQNRPMTVDKLIDDVASKYVNLLNQQGNLTTLHATADVRAKAFHGTKPGTWIGEGVRTVMQFKTPGLAAWNLSSEILMSNPEKPANSLLGAFKGKGDMKALAQFAVGSTSMAMLAMVAKSYVAGSKMPDIHSKEAWLEAFLKGGAATLAGDIALNPDKDNPRRSLGADLAGPLVGAVNDVQELVTLAAKKDKKAGRAGLELIMKNNPLDVFYTSRAWNALLNDPIREWQSPGYTYRRKRSEELKKQKLHK